MYVVRIIDIDDVTDYKAFTALPDAVKRFKEADARVLIDDVKSVRVFEVPGTTNAREAVEAVKVGKAILLKQDAIAGL